MTLFYFIFCSCFFFFLLGDVYEYFVLVEHSRAQRSPIAIENGNQSIAENLVMTSAYVVRRPHRL